MNRSSKKAWEIIAGFRTLGILRYAQDDNCVGNRRGARIRYGVQEKILAGGMFKGWNPCSTDRKHARKHGSITPEY
jgi:hypothetical protein